MFYSCLPTVVRHSPDLCRQRVFRGFQGRVFAQRWALKYAEIEVLKYVLHEAAINIQRTYRGHLGRVEASEVIRRMVHETDARRVGEWDGGGRGGCGRLRSLPCVFWDNDVWLLSLLRHTYRSKGDVHPEEKKGAARVRPLMLSIRTIQRFCF